MINKNYDNFDNFITQDDFINQLFYRPCYDYTKSQREHLINKSNPNHEIMSNDKKYAHQSCQSENDSISQPHQESQFQKTHLHKKKIRKQPKNSKLLENCSQNAQESFKKTKNSNVIKKIGRIILDHKKWYNLPHESQNIAFAKMQTVLLANQKKERLCDKRDNFSTKHYQLLLNTEDQALNSFNLKTTRILIGKQLRKNILTSKLISKQNKIMYMTTLKNLALRCCNNRLALRLQMSFDK